LPFPLRARLHVDVQATRKTLERLENSTCAIERGGRTIG
jgi:hypothetical protein